MIRALTMRLAQLTSPSAEVAKSARRGDKPVGRPIQAPTKVPFIVDLDAAKVLGATIKPTLLAQAGEIVA